MTIKQVGRQPHRSSSLRSSGHALDAPGDARQLVGERDRKDVVVQSLLGGLDPGLEAMALLHLGFDQHDPSRLHK